MKRVVIAAAAICLSMVSIGQGWAGTPGAEVTGGRDRPGVKAVAYEPRGGESRLGDQKGGTSGAKGSKTKAARPPKGAAAKPRRLAIFKQINCLFEARVGSGAPAACNPTTIKAPSKEEVLRRPSVDRLRRLASDRAIALAPLPKLRIAPSEVGLTGLDSYFWLDEIPTTIEAVAEVPGLRVIAQARPIEYRWSFGEGRASTTTHIGRRWTGRRPGSISHRYETKGTYLLSIEVVWEARWRSGGGPWSRLGFFTNRATRTYTVREAFGVLVKPE